MGASGRRARAHVERAVWRPIIIFVLGGVVVIGSMSTWVTWDSPSAGEGSVDGIEGVGAITLVLGLGICLAAAWQLVGVHCTRWLALTAAVLFFAVFVITFYVRVFPDEFAGVPHEIAGLRQHAVVAANAGQGLTIAYLASIAGILVAGYLAAVPPGSPDWPERALRRRR